MGKFPGTSYNLLYDQQKSPVRTRQNLVVFPTTFFAEQKSREVSPSGAGQPSTQEAWLCLGGDAEVVQADLICRWFHHGLEIPDPNRPMTKMCVLKGFPMELPRKKREVCG